MIGMNGYELTTAGYSSGSISVACGHCHCAPCHCVTIVSPQAPSAWTYTLTTCYPDTRPMITVPAVADRFSENAKLFLVAAILHPTDEELDAGGRSSLITLTKGDRILAFDVQGARDEAVRRLPPDVDLSRVEILVRAF